MKNISLLVALLVVFSSGFSQVPSPIKQKYKSILFQNGTAHVGNGVVVMDAVIGVVDGKISFIKNALTYVLVKEEWDTIINIRGKHIYPGFIAANLTLGLTEIDAIRATRDFDEVGAFNPNIRALIAYNTDSRVIYTVRTNGVLVTQSTPRGGIISGSSSVIALDGWNWEDAVYKADDGVHLNWPKKYNTTGWWAEPGPSSANENYNMIRKDIYSFFEAAKGYAIQKNQDDFSLQYAAMKDVFTGEKRLFIHVDYAPEINDVIDFVRLFGIKFPVLIGGKDANLLAERLKENNLSVLLGRPHALPVFEEDLTYSNYQEAYTLQEAGVLFGIQGEGDMEVMNARNLPFLAGTAWAYGLTEEQAVASISLNIAKILGVDKQLGSLEPGKDATLFVSDGNALDMRTNNVVIAMVKGKFISLENHQIKLSHIYHEKYELAE